MSEAVIRKRRCTADEEYARSLEQGLCDLDLTAEKGEPAETVLNRSSRGQDVRTQDS